MPLRLALLALVVLASCESRKKPPRPTWRDDPALRTNVYLEDPPELLERPEDQ